MGSGLGTCSWQQPHVQHNNMPCMDLWPRSSYAPRSCGSSACHTRHTTHACTCTTTHARLSHAALLSLLPHGSAEKPPGCAHATSAQHLFSAFSPTTRRFFASNTCCLSIFLPCLLFLLPAAATPHAFIHTTHTHHHYHALHTTTATPLLMSRFLHAIAHTPAFAATHTCATLKLQAALYNGFLHVLHARALHNTLLHARTLPRRALWHG